jgi:homoserine dehydrogenase
MATKKQVVKVAIVGLGRVGSTFLNNLILYEDHSIKIIAAVERKDSTPGVKQAKYEDIIIYRNVKNLTILGEDIDIIFDFTGDPDVVRELRRELAASGNKHTVVAPEVVSLLIWHIMKIREEFPEFHPRKGY